MKTQALLLTAALLTLSACKDKGTDDTGGLIGTTDGGGSDAGGSDAGGSDGGTADCTVGVSETDPSDGETGWYWRDDLSVTLDGATDGAVYSLADSGGTDIALTQSTSEGGLVYTLTPGSGMTGSETYTLTVDVCGSSHTVTFQTDEFGAPLDGLTTDLVGGTYYFDLPGATFVQPVGVGALLSTFLDMPILVGVTAADDSLIDLLGAQGMRDKTEAWVQDTTQLTWDFPAASFESAPYFLAIADEIIIGYTYGGDFYEIPVYGFQIEGTFAADAQSIGGGRALGLGDTRNMGPLMGAGDGDTALCDMLSGLGLACELCPDGVESCLTLEVEFPEAPLMDGITLQELVAR